MHNYSDVMEETKTFPPKMGAFYELMAWVENFLNSHLKSAHSRQMQLVLEEVIVNCIQHGRSTSDISLTLSFNQKLFSALIIDTGIPFDINKYHSDLQKNTSIEERKLGGLGVFFVKELMDTVEYERKDKQNILSLKKEFS